ncbi:MAG: hypothetical protein M3021_00665, partial [Actinomycetota bacterium]|nr:hypothetical protein [Actinomycetota bacterium]
MQAQILVPLDGAALAESTRPQAAAVAQATGRGLDATGISPGSPPDPGTFAWLTADLRPAVRLLAE